MQLFSIDVQDLVNATTILSEILMLKNKMLKKLFKIHYSSNLHIIDMHYRSNNMEKYNLSFDV